MVATDVPPRTERFRQRGIDVQTALSAISLQRLGVYEMQNAKQDSQSRRLLEVTDDFRKFTLTRFANVFAALRKW
jgi:hypothetical protein